MLPKINNINIKNFRGVRDISLALGKSNSLLIIGDNGTGKSSIVDAIEFFFKLEISKLSGRQDISLSECIPFSNCNPLSCMVEMGFDSISNPVKAIFIPSGSGKGSAKRDNSPDLKKTFDFASKHNFVLHRAQLTRFIESKPADRYNNISDLIGLEFLDKTVDTWKKERNERERRKNEHQKAFLESTRELSNFLNRPIISQADIVTTINARLNGSGIEPINSFEEIESVKSKFLINPVFSQNQDLSDRYRGLIAQIRRFSNEWQWFITAYEKLYQSWQYYLVRAENLVDADFLGIIKDSQKLISEKQLALCPVCEQAINPIETLSRLEIRAQKLSELNAASVIVEENRKEADRIFSLCVNVWNEIENYIMEFQFSKPDEITHFTHLLESKKHILNGMPLALEPIHYWISEPTVNNAFEAIRTLEIKTSEQIGFVTPNENERKIADLAFFLGQVNEKAANWNKAKSAAEKAAREFNFIDQLYLGLVETRKQGVSQIIESLEKDFLYLFEKLHPGEGHKAIKIILIPERSASADILTESDGLLPMHPLGNYSEGHLDSLGLCIFLAFIRRYNKDFPLIVLDDVLTSIDAGHRMKVAQLLATEFKNYQIVITTHDELWGNELATVMRKEQTSLKIVRMKPWTKESGASCDEYVSTNWEYYRQQIASGKSQDAIGSAGRNLEKFLATMRRNLHLSIPATIDDRYMLGSLSPAFWKWVGENHIQRPDIPDFSQRMEMLRDEYDAYLSFRNWSGAHYNEWGSTVSDNEALSFISILEELVGYFECPVCKSLVVYDTSRKLVHCPICTPSPAQKISWEYKPQWAEQANRLVSNLGSMKNSEKHLLSLSKSAFEKLLRDLRKRMQLLVVSKLDDSYNMADLYPSLIQQLLMHPNELISEWDDEVEFIDKEFRQFITKEFTWLDDEILLPQVDHLLYTIKIFACILSCPNCHELLNLDGNSGEYICSTCSTQAEEPRIFPAAWFVSK